MYLCPGLTTFSLTKRQVVEPGTGLPTIHEGQLYLNVFPTQAAIHIESQRLEITLKRILQNEGDLFAFKAQPSTGAEGSVFSAIAEYCDNDASLRAVARFNNVIVEVCLCGSYFSVEVTH
jgi:hypothetical protein